MPTKKDDATPTTPKQAIEQHAKDQNTEGWLFAAAKALHRWPIGMELTAEEYAAGLTAAKNVEIR